ncbi:MAG: superoxide dismutase [Parvibaculum sp.]|uniref:superoxide dismutase n=1 Tax=Parvibaculum sp. TaxID=2024848 RepID=UPI003C7348EA
MIELPPLPYAKDALAPHISAETLSVHHGKHHKAYVDTTNKLIAGTEFEKLKLEEIIKRTASGKEHKKLFNNAAQIWNHTFYWHSMAPKGGGKPKGKLADQINVDFGSFEKFHEQFHTAGVGQFGSGWVWLVFKDGKLKIEATSNADNPLAHGETALLCSDVWEHAYYIDYQNRRPDYLKSFLDDLCNWSFAEENFATARAQSKAA